MFGLLVTWPEFGSGQAQVEAGQVRVYLGQGRIWARAGPGCSKTRTGQRGVGPGQVQGKKVRAAQTRTGPDQCWPVLQSGPVYWVGSVYRFGPVWSVWFN